jgi:glucose-6-phosphate 1-dehydrogenase
MSENPAPTLVIFGASGDLTARKLVPALYQLERKQRLPAGTRIVGVSRTSWNDEQFREHLQERSAPKDRAGWQEFARRIHYRPGDLQNADDYTALVRFLDALDGGSAGRLFYLAIAPQLYAGTIEQLGHSRLASEE